MMDSQLESIVAAGEEARARVESARVAATARIDEADRARRLATLGEQADVALARAREVAAALEEEDRDESVRRRSWARGQLGNKL